MGLAKLLKTAAAAACAAFGLAGAMHAQASIVIAGTRVVYNEADTEETLKLSNEGKNPALVQVWIDDGDPQAGPSTINVPFTVTPPISRIDPAKGQTLRIIYTGEALPRDKESVFWLNVLEVPPKPSADEAGANRLELAFRSRIKMFFRPAGLKGAAADAPAQLAWRLTRAGDSPAVEAHNPTPYYVTITGVTVGTGGREATFDEGGMVAPGERTVFPLKGSIAALPAQVNYHALNDFGGDLGGTAPLTQGAAGSDK